MRRLVTIAAAALVLAALVASGQIPPPASRKIEQLKPSAVVEPTSVKLNKREIWVFVPYTWGRPAYRLQATVLPENATNKKIAWESSDPSVAAVHDDGTVWPQKVGTAVVKAVARANGVAAECRVVVETKNKYSGNTISGLFNDGHLAHQGSWIYFSDWVLGGRLSKMKIEGGAVIQLCEDSASFINVRGDTIHYVNGSDGKKLYSIDIYGENRKWLNDSNPVHGAQRYGSQILYGSLDPNNRIGLYTIEADGTGRRVVDWPGLGSVASFYRVGDSVLYSFFRREGGRLAGMGLILYRPLKPASAAIEASDAEHRGFTAWIDERGAAPRVGTIFYISLAGEIRRIDGFDDAKRRKDVLVVSPRPPARTLSHEGGWIYYGSDLGVNKVRGDGRENQVLARIPASTLPRIYPVALGDRPEETWVYYFVVPQKDGIGGTRLYRVRGNGLDNSLVR